MRQVTVDTTKTYGVCRKCKKDKPTYRHHKGFDSFFAKYNKGIGSNYHRFHYTVLICLDCHIEIHWLYELRLRTWVNRTAKGAREMRQTLIAHCDDWLAGRVKVSGIPQRFKDRFYLSHHQWQKEK